MLPLHHPLLSVAATGREVDLPQPSLIDLVDDLHQRLAAWGLLLCGEQVSLLHAGWSEVGQHDTPFLVTLFVAPDAGEQLGDQGQQRSGVMGGRGQLGAHLVAVIGLPIAERAGANEQGHVPAAHPLPPQLFGGPLHVTGQRLVHGADLGDALAERSRADDLLLGLSFLLQLGAGDPPQLLHRALDHHAIATPQRLGVSGDQVGHGLDALRLQLGGEPQTNAPYLVHRGDRHEPSAPPYILASDTM